MAANWEIEMETVDVHQSVRNRLQVTADDNNDLEQTSRDRHSSVRSLTVLASRLQDCKTLMDLAEQHFNLRNFFVIAGNYWPNKGWFILARAMFVINRISIFVCVFLLATFMGYLISISYKFLGNPGAIYIVFRIALLFVLMLGALSVLPAQYFNRLRFSMPAEIEDFMVVDGCIKTSLLYGVLSTMCVYVGVVLQCLQPEYMQPVFLVTCLASSFVVLSLMFNMFFLLLDLSVSVVLLDQLHVLADKKLLTIDKFNMVRTEIHRRVRASRLACDFIIIPSLASIVGILISLLTINEAYTYSNEYQDDDYRNTLIWQSVGLILVQLKELFFLSVAFMYVAKVNARADELTLKLSEGFWGNYKSITEPDGPVEPVQLADLHRISMHISSISQPISFTLLFKRVSYGNVIISAVSFGITVLVGFLKSTISSSVQ